MTLPDLLSSFKLRRAELVQQIQQICGNVIFGDTTSGNPKEMGFTELDFSMRGSDP